MYNEKMPNQAELPTTKQLIKSTVIAFVTAIAILVTVVLPSEYAIDPTGVGRVLGLAEMGEIKQQLSIEAEQDHGQPSPIKQQLINEHDTLNMLVSLFTIKTANAETPATSWKDTITFELTPSQGIEYKLKMKKDASAYFDWSVSGGKANYDLHGDGNKQSIRYKKGRGMTGEKGSLKAAFDGYHGWFWRNRDKQPITITLRLKGDYSELKKMK
ncbi:MAG: transmembrane anchor protein [Rhodospirillales bacterium]|nr:transmembrane anchor protein [Rhodospirillales bacterium]